MWGTRCAGGSLQRISYRRVQSEGVAKAGLHGALPVLLCDLTEGCVGVVCVRRIPVGVVGEVEGIEAEGQGLALEGFEALQNGRIEVCLSWSAEEVSDMFCGEGAGGGQSKDGRSVGVRGVEPGIVVATVREFAVALQVCSGCDLQQL